MRDRVARLVSRVAPAWNGLGISSARPNGQFPDNSLFRKKQTPVGKVQLFVFIDEFTGGGPVLGGKREFFPVFSLLSGNFLETS